MKTIILGPTFSLHTHEPTDAITERLAAWITDMACPFEGTRAGAHFQITTAPNTRHRWSPWLTIEVTERHAQDNAEHFNQSELRAEESPVSATVYGRFNPSPAIWSAYMLGSLALLTTALGALMWATAELIMGEPPRALWVIPACAAVLIVMWVISAAGQKLAAEEMTAMRSAIEAIVSPGD